MKKVLKLIIVALIFVTLDVKALDIKATMKGSAENG